MRSGNVTFGNERAMDYRAHAWLLAACALLLPVLVAAQTTSGDWVGLDQNYLVPPKVDAGISPLDVDHAFGDHINLQNGGVQFRVTDISVRGNSGLPVELSRTLDVQDLTHNPGDLMGFGDWSIAIPNLHGTFISGVGWQTSASTNPNVRCTHPGSPVDLPDFASYQYWNGYWLDVPGYGQQAMLENPTTQLPAPSSGSYPWITKAFWRIGCEASTANGYPGEGFLAVSPEGVRYHFDYVVQMPAASIVRGWTPGGSYSTSEPRSVVYFLVTRIEDRFGNAVTYTYSGNHLQSIQSNHGRYINLTWSGGNVVAAVSNAGTWYYAYSGNALATVTLPDTTSWSYSHTGNMGITPDPSLPLYQQTPTCTPPQVSTGAFTYQVTSPSNAVAEFDFDVERHGLSNVPKYCNSFLMPGGGGANQMVSYEWLTIPNYFDTFTLTSKQVTGPGIPTATWTYSYSGPAGFFFANACHIPTSTTTCPEFSTTEVAGPDGIYERFLYGAWYGVNEGELLEVDTGTDSSHLLRTVTTSYSDGTSQPFPNVVGTNPLLYSDQFTSAALRPQSASVTTQDGATFTTAVNAYDVFARATSATESSSLGYAKTDTTSYADDTSAWVLGLVTGTATNGIAVSKTLYDSLDRPTSRYAFGKLVATDAWNADGTLASVTDGNGHTTAFAGWYRGLPQTLTFADGTTRTAVINGAGWITSLTDENHATTGYQYDPMGRLKEIDYPTGPNDSWNATTLSFAPVNATELGIPPGHWDQVVQTGNGRTITYFDALWRPLVTARYDTGNEGATLTQVVHLYDAGGRTVFTSYPTNAATAYTQALPGTYTDYDALNRVTDVVQDSELGAPVSTVTQYLPGFETQVTDPNGFSTTTSYYAYGSPDTHDPRQIAAPAGVTTTVTRDVFGKPLWIARNGTTYEAFVYDANQQVCKHLADGQVTGFGYDGAGNLAWSAAGANGYADGTCDVTPRDAGAHLVTRTYDARNRLTDLAFSDGDGNQHWTYTPAGQPAQVTTANLTAAGTVTVTNGYAYDARGLLTQETLSIPGQINWSLGYAYDANGHPSVRFTPSGQSYYTSPDALGQPTMLGIQGVNTYVYNITHFPDGHIAAFRWANGITHQVSENVRGLPSEIHDSAAGNDAEDLTYAYDADGNPVRIADWATGARSTTATYDGLDRLTGAAISGIAGGATATYAYDALGRIASMAQGSEQKTFTYDRYYGDELVSTADTQSGTTTFGYDAQGNLASRNGVAYQFDYGNRLRAVPGEETGYVYDAWGRRVQQTDLTGTLASFYDRAGELIYQRDRAGGSHDYLYLDGHLIAIRDYSAQGIALGLRYQHTDALGSVIRQTDPTGAELPNTGVVYDAWGGEHGVSMQDGPGYTGHLEDADTGLVYMQQRYYDPSVGRFLSVDPVDASGTDGSNLDRYWYANDSPYRYTDPFGECPTDSKPCPPPPPKPKPQPKPITLPTITVTGHAIPAAPIPSTGFRPIELPKIGIFVNPLTVFLGGILVPGNLAPSDCGDGRCVMMSAGSKKGFWPGDTGAAEWGRRHGVGTREGKAKFHDAIKQHTPGARGDDDFRTNPETGEVIDQHGDEVGNLNDENNQGAGNG